jgi:hypothetical protein
MRRLIIACSVFGYACNSEPLGPLNNGDAGTQGTPANDGGSTSSSPDASGTVSASGLPCEVDQMLMSSCQSCHGTTPAAGAPMSLVTYADLTAPALSDPTKKMAEMSVIRIQDTARPMPPAPAAAPAASGVMALQAWIAAGYPMGGCATSTTTPDPLNAAPTCTTKTFWGLGTDGSARMEPGMACINCHTTAGGPEAPLFSLAGTVYATGHEPDQCNGTSSTPTVQVTDAQGATITLTPNTVGNFFYSGTVALPYTAKVLYMGKERAMATPQTSGDCNSCHQQTGQSGAPGRIVLPM